MLVTSEYYKKYVECELHEDVTDCDDKDIRKAVRRGELYVLRQLNRVNSCCSCSAYDYSNDVIVKNAICEFAFAWLEIDFQGEENNNDNSQTYRENAFNYLSVHGYLRQ